MRLLFIFLLLLSSLAEARMYQWVEPGVETTQLSGKPPAWYRSSSGGPRIFVFENGRLIDDTGVEVSDEVRQRLRQEAFIMAEEDRQKAKEKIAKANKLKEKFAKTEQQQEEVTPDIEEESNDKLLTDSLFPEEIVEEPDNDENIEDIEELKRIIADWEASQSESARKALE